MRDQRTHCPGGVFVLVCVGKGTGRRGVCVCVRVCGGGEGGGEGGLSVARENAC